jgi:hypothetical protein
MNKRQEETMQQTAISFSDNVLLSLNMTTEEIIISMRKEYAKKMYQDGKLTLGQCAEFCDMDKYDLSPYCPMPVFR